MKAEIYHALPLRETDLTLQLHKKYGDKVTFIGKSMDGKRRMEIELDLKNSIINIMYHEDG